jgi:hypothetical protein
VLIGTLTIGLLACDSEGPSAESIYQRAQEADAALKTYRIGATLTVSTSEETCETEFEAMIDRERQLVWSRTSGRCEGELIYMEVVFDAVQTAGFQREIAGGYWNETLSRGAFTSALDLIGRSESQLSGSAPKFGASLEGLKLNGIASIDSQDTYELSFGNTQASISKKDYRTLRLIRHFEVGGFNTNFRFDFYDFDQPVEFPLDSPIR